MIPTILEPDLMHARVHETCMRAQQYKRILVIDDNSDIVFTLRIGLESDPTMQAYGYDNPVTALLESKFYDLLLIDVNMPLLDGFN